jgi:beta-glucanase (GH16 family)
LPSGLTIDTGFIAKDQPNTLNHRFDAKNVVVKDGFLQLTVPGGQTGDTISSAEVATTFELLHGSVTTYAILTDTAGVCNGMFFYKSDNQESDIEWISDPESKSNLNSPNGTRAMQYTNQAVKAGSKATMVYGPAPDDATSAVHAYRIDWTEGSTKYYLDDVLQHTMTTNVPSEAGPWVWNSWNNGDPFWTGPPPKTDAVFKIQKIVMHYNPAGTS